MRIRITGQISERLMSKVRHREVGDYSVRGTAQTSEKLKFELPQWELADPLGELIIMRPAKKPGTHSQPSTKLL